MKLKLKEFNIYLDETILTEMGIEEVDANQYGYFIVKYNLGKICA